MPATHATGEALELTDRDLLPLRTWRRAQEDPQHPSFSHVVDGDWQTITAGEHLESCLLYTSPSPRD